MTWRRKLFLFVSLPLFGWALAIFVFTEVSAVREISSQESIEPERFDEWIDGTEKGTEEAGEDEGTEEGTDTADTDYPTEPSKGLEWPEEYTEEEAKESTRDYLGLTMALSSVLGALASLISGIATLLEVVRTRKKK